MSRPILAALALLALALALRLPRGDLAEWKGDEAVEFHASRAIAENARAGELGLVLRARGLPTTEGPRCPVHAFHFFAASLLVSDSPEAPRVLVALLASGAIAALFLLGRRDLGARASLAAALVLAAHPGLVREGRWAWLPNLAPPVALLVLLALARAEREPRGRSAGALVALSTLLAFLHYSTVGIATLGAVASVRALARGASGRAFGAGCAVSLALAAPYLASEVGSDFHEVRAALKVAREGGRATAKDAPERAALAYPREVAAALDLERFARALGPSGEAAAREHGPPAALLRALSALLALAAIAGVFVGARELVSAFRRRERIGPAGLALAVLLAGWAPFLLLGLPARAHYAATAVPALAALVGVAISGFSRVCGRFIGRDTGVSTKVSVAALALLTLGLVGVFEVRGVLAAIDAGKAEPGSAYDLPLRDKRGACEVVLENELELARWRRLEDLVLLEAAFRELARRDPERARRFGGVSLRENYWELSVEVPRPLAPRGRAALETAPAAGTLQGEIARCGAIVVRRVP